MIMSQSVKEWAAWLDLITRNDLNSVLEIGTGKGATTVSLSKNILGPLVSIDIAERHPNLDSISIPFHYIQGESQSQEVIEKIKKISNKFDVIFVDGYHAYEAVKMDLETCLDLVNKEKGLIGFHDIAVTWRPWFGVHKLWEEIKHDYKHIEIMPEPPEVYYGIGVLMFGDVK